MYVSKMRRKVVILSAQRAVKKMGQRLIFYDFETNGLWSPLNQPIEVCMLIRENGTETKFTKLIKPPYKLSNIIIEKTGITDELLAEQGIELSEAFRLIRGILFENPDTKLIGFFNRRFDDRFLNYYLQKYWERSDGIENIIFKENNIFDCAAYFKAELLGAKPHPEETVIQFEKRMVNARCEHAHTLTDAVNFYGIESDGKFHRAEPDAIKTRDIYDAIQHRATKSKRTASKQPA